MMHLPDTSGIAIPPMAYSVRPSICVLSPNHPHAVKVKMNMGYDEVPTKEDGDESQKSTLSNRSKLHHFKPLVFLLFLIVYSFLGGLLFFLIENQTARQLFELDELQNQKLKTQAALAIYNLLNLDEFMFANNFYNYNNTRNDSSINDTSTFDCIFSTINDTSNLNTTSLLPYPELMNILDIMANNIIRQDARDKGDWSFFGSVFYAGTVYSTIGYGNIIPHTITGRIVTIVYAVFGIPIMLYTLAQMGKMFCAGLLHLYLYVRFFICRCGRDNTQAVDMINEFPLSVAFVITVLWMCMCSGIFCAWEERWSFFTSFYFFFQSLTTIGLGDVTPDHTKHMLSSFMLIIIGMTLVSMCLNLVQLKMERFINDSIERIRNHYLQTELKDGKMMKDPMSVYAEIAKISNAQSAFLSAVMSDVAKERLVGEWQKKAALCNVGVQASVRMKDAWVDFRPVMKSQITQSLPPILPPSGGGGGGSTNSSDGYSSSSPSRSLEIPLKESSRRRTYSATSDEFRMKLQELGFILSECNVLVKDLH